MEGAIAWAIAARPGMWRRAGIGGECCGLDYTAALASPAARDADADVLDELLVSIEAGALVALSKRRADDGRS